MVLRASPASVEDRAVPGHWEGDLLCGSSNSCIVTLVERHSRYVLLAKVANSDSRSVITALIDSDRERRSATKHRQSAFKHVLRQPAQSAVKSGH